MRAVWAIAVAAIIALAGCSTEKRTPPRDQIPVIKEAVYQLQERVKARDVAAIDSLLSARILDREQGSDSLLRYVYGPQETYAFEQFGACDIAYTKDAAVANCYVMDSAHAMDRPIRLSFINDDGEWLLAAFGPGEAEADTADTADTVR